MAKTAVAASIAVERRILLLRGQRVLLGQQLAALYGVQTRVLMQSVQRNRDRFPGDFMFELNVQGLENLKSQFVTSNWAVCAGRPTRSLESLERKYDRQFKVVFDAIRELMEPPLPPKKRRIGFS